MTRPIVGAALVLAGATMMAAQVPAPAPAAAPAVRRAAGAPPTSRTFQPPPTFQTYCFECHGGDKHKGDVSIERLIRLSAQSSAGEYWEEWNKVAEMLESGEMPPKDKADLFPSDEERAATT